VSRDELPPARLLAASIMMGAAISGMHYTGMAAMRMPATIRYAPVPFLISIGIAVTASYVALWLAYRYRHDESIFGNWRRAWGAVEPADRDGVAGR